MSISKSFLLRIVACIFMIVFCSCGKVTVKAEFKYEIWMNDLEIEFEKLGKEFKKNGQKAGKEFKKMGIKK